jgi:hypothetical protein
MDTEFLRLEAHIYRVKFQASARLETAMRLWAVIWESRQGELESKRLRKKMLMV